MGKNKAFAHFGAAGRNHVWSWSARSPDGKTVVLTLWEDQFDRTATPVTYSNFNSKDLAFWKDQLGNRERKENIKWAKKNCGSRFRVVITKAKDKDARPRSIADAQPD